MSEYIEFDTSELVLDGTNLAETIQSNKKIVFNETYMVVGRGIKAPSVFASYDLVVQGNLDADEIEVRGNLFVLGDIKTHNISCLKTITCSGNIDAHSIYSNDIIANDIVCSSISCSGNVIVRSTIDIGESLKTEKSVIAGEGILGTGQFEAKNAIAVEYLAFDGDLLGKAVELDLEDENSEDQPAPTTEDSIQGIREKLKQVIAEELYNAGQQNEDQLIELVENLSNADHNMISDWYYLTDNLIEISYKDKITNLRDYLIIIMSVKTLPKEIVEYETLEHIFSKLLIAAEKELPSLPFHAQNVDDIAYSLKAVSLCGNDLKIDSDELLDRVFQSIGIKYKTVKSFLG